MKKLSKMSTVELAAFVAQHMRRHGIETVLTGGGCATIYSSEKYFSGDLDYVNMNYVSIRKITEVLKLIGFLEAGRGYRHHEARQAVDIVKAPLSIGEERIERVNEIEMSGNTLKLLTPTDCVKDRLAAYYYWNDRQALETAVLVATSIAVDLEDIRRWSIREEMAAKFEFFVTRLRGI